MADLNVIDRSRAMGGTNRENGVRLNDLPPNDPVVRANGSAPRTIDGTERPADGDRLEERKISPPPLGAATVANAASSAGVGTPTRMPDFAFAVIKIAMAREVFGSDKLKTLAAQVREQLGDVDVLLDLSSELTALPDKDSHEVSDKMKGLIARLEVHKIQIWKGDKTLSKEKLERMKAQISSQIDKLRTAIQTKISTEIQPEANNLQAIMNIVQQIIQSDARLKRKTTEVPR